MGQYKIKSGDTLTSIAAQHGTTVDEIASANGIKNKNLIYAGQSINIPTATGNTSGAVKTENNGGTVAAPKAAVNGLKQNGESSIGTAYSYTKNGSTGNSAASGKKLGSNNVLQALGSLGSDAAVGVSAAGGLAGLAASGAGAAVGMLTGAITSAVAAGDYLEAKRKLKELEANNPEFKHSQEYTDLWDTINEAMDNPPEWADQYAGVVEKYLDDYVNRDKFSYDYESDPTFQSYRDRYIREGKLAMEDTVADVAGLSGGYGNSYAATAGSQAYQSHLSKLNDIVPELQQQAYERYQAEGQELLNRFESARAMRSDDYDYWKGTEYQQWEDNMNYSMQMAEQLSEEDWNKFLYEQYNPWLENYRRYQTQKADAANAFMSGGQTIANSLTDFGGAVSGMAADYGNMAMQNAQWKDEMAYKRAESDREQSNIDREYDLALKEFNADQAERDRQYNLSVRKYNDSKNGGGNGNGDGDGGDDGGNGGLTFTYPRVVGLLTEQNIDSSHVMNEAKFNQNASYWKSKGINSYQDYLAYIIEQYLPEEG